MFWILLFVGIAVIGLVVAFFSLRWVYRQFRALLRSLDGAARKLSDGVRLLSEVDSPGSRAGRAVNGVDRPDDGVDSEDMSHSQEIVVSLPARTEWPAHRN